MSQANEAMFEQAVAHARARAFDPASAILRELLAQAPDDHRALNLLGQIAHQRNAYDEALALHERALALAGDRKDYLVDRALALAQLGRLADAEADYHRALAIDPNFAPALGNLGRVHALRGDHDKAIELYVKALATNSAAPSLHVNLAAALCETARFEEGERAARQGLMQAPRHAGLLSILGYALSRLARTEQAREVLRRAVTLDPGHRVAFDNLLLVEHYSDSVTRSELFELHRRFGAVFEVPGASRPGRVRSGRLRIGYVSPDFRDHAVASFIGPVLRDHDRDRCEVFAYHCDAREDKVGTMLRARADHWRPVGHLPAAQAAAEIRADRIDVLVDLAGHTSRNRLDVFEHRPAAVQATWIGYPDTTGVSAIDLRITDAVADPPGSEAWHTERLLRLPGCFLTYEPFDIRLPDMATRSEVVFGSFNNAAKITDRTLELWGMILDRMGGARLVLKAHAFAWGAVVERMRARAIAAGIDPARLMFLPQTVAREDHLAQYGLIDIALDTVPYNGTTTTCEAMWMGVPVVTMRGDRHCARVGASLLTAVGLPELVGESDDGYVDIAVTLAQDRERLGELKAGLRARMAASPLCDAVSFTRRLEEAFLAL